MKFDNEEEEKQNQTFVFCFSPLKFLCLSPMNRGGIMRARHNNFKDPMPRYEEEKI